jgi:hypothetical protein
MRTREKRKRKREKEKEKEKEKRTTTREVSKEGLVDNGCQPPCLTFWRNGAWDTKAYTPCLYLTHSHRN